MPVVCHANQSKIVSSCIHASQLWSQIQHFHLTINMRVNPEQIDFANYLLTLGNGTSPVYPHIGEDIIRIPGMYLADSTEELIDKVFPELENGYTDRYFVSHRAILTPLNANVDKLNEDYHGYVSWCW